MGRWERRDLLRAYLGARRWAQAAEPLRDWHRRRYEALSAAFGVDLESPPDPGVGALFEAAVRSLERVGPPRSEAAREVRESHLRLLEEMLELTWGLAPGARVYDEELRRHGFDPLARPPDPLDFM